MPCTSCPYRHPSSPHCLLPPMQRCPPLCSSPFSLHHLLNPTAAVVVPQHAGGPPTSLLPSQLCQMVAEVLEPAEQIHQKSASVFSLMAVHAQTLRSGLFGALQGFTAAVEALGQQALQVGTAASIQTPAVLD